VDDGSGGKEVFRACPRPSSAAAAAAVGEAKKTLVDAGVAVDGTESVGLKTAALRACARDGWPTRTRGVKSSGGDGSRGRPLRNLAPAPVDLMRRDSPTGSQARRVRRLAPRCWPCSPFLCAVGKKLAALCRAITIDDGKRCGAAGAATRPGGLAVTCQTPRHPCARARLAGKHPLKARPGYRPPSRPGAASRPWASSPNGQHSRAGRPPPPPRPRIAARAWRALTARSRARCPSCGHRTRCWRRRAPWRK
jgi:hypothetical protein